MKLPQPCISFLLGSYCTMPLSAMSLAIIVLKMNIKALYFYEELQQTSFFNLSSPACCLLTHGISFSICLCAFGSWQPQSASG